MNLNSSHLQALNLRRQTRLLRFPPPILACPKVYIIQVLLRHTMFQISWIHFPCPIQMTISSLRQPVPLAWTIILVPPSWCSLILRCIFYCRCVSLAWTSLAVLGTLTICGFLWGVCCKGKVSLMTGKWHIGILAKNNLY